MMTCVHLPHARVPLPAIFGIAIPTSLVAAECMNRVIEQPSIALGRRLSSLPALQWTFAGVQNWSQTTDP
jgi:peptidoglycan/LPS O-acetylase OafA/YrhL